MPYQNKQGVQGSAAPLVVVAVAVVAIVIVAVVIVAVVVPAVLAMVLLASVVTESSGDANGSSRERAGPAPLDKPG